MDWLSNELLFSLFDAASGVIPLVNRVCRHWRYMAREYIRIYRPRALTVNIRLDENPTIYTTTSDGVENGIRIDYVYGSSPFLARIDQNMYLMPTVITETCMGVKHGRCITFTKGDISNYTIYDNGKIVRNKNFKIQDLIGIRDLLQQFKSNETVDDDALGLTTVDRGSVRYKFTPDGRIHHKLPIGTNYAYMREMKPPVQNMLLSYRSGKPRLEIKMIYNYWMSEATYYAPDQTIKMVFMHRYMSISSQEIIYDNGYRIIRQAQDGQPQTDIGIVYGNGDTIAFECVNRAPKMCRCGSGAKVNKCVRCQHRQLRQDLARAWNMVPELVRRYDLACSGK